MSYSAVNGEEAVAYTYNSAGLLSSIATDSTTYSLTYDVYGNADKVAIGSATPAD
jgi:hypothetical protein